MVNGPSGVAWPLCACASAATDSHDALVSPTVPISLDVSEWVQHQNTVWWVQSWLLCAVLEVTLASEILQEAGHGQMGGGTQEQWRNFTHKPPFA